MTEPPDVPGDITVAVKEWIGEKGTAWADRNPVDVDGTNTSWDTRFGVTKTDAVYGVMAGVVPRGTTWLDIGCAAGAHAHVLRDLGYTCDHGCDLNHPALSKFRGYGVVADARHLPYGDNTFDGVTTSGALMHVGGEGHTVDAVRELARVARHYILTVELWQPRPMVIDFAGLLPTAWVYPWEKVMPSVLGDRWSLARSAVVRTVGKVHRVQPMGLCLWYYEPEDPAVDHLVCERPYPWWAKGDPTWQD